MTTPSLVSVLRAKVFAAGLLLLFGASPLQADQIIHLGALKTAVEYDTNPLMRADRGTGFVWLGLIQPMYRGYWIQDPTSRFQLDIEMRVEQSSDQRQISNREDPTVELFWDYRGERNDFDFTAYSSSAPVRLVEFDESAVTGTNGTRVVNKVMGEWKHDWDAATRLTNVASYSYTRYEKIPLIDFYATDLRSEGEWRQSDALAYTGRAKLVFMDPVFNALSGLTEDQVVPTNLQGGFGGVEWEVSPLWLVQAEAGLVRTDRIGQDLDINADIKATYERPRLEMMGQVSRTTAPSGFGGFVTGDTLKVQATYDAGVREEWELIASYRKNVKPNRNESMRLGLFHRYKMSRLWTVTSSWEYKQSDGFGGASGMVTRVTLEFSPG